jgi:hypothetical protein
MMKSGEPMTGSERRPFIMSNSDIGVFLSGFSAWASAHGP